MKSAGKARNNGLYRHIRTSKEIIRNLLNDSLYKLEVVAMKFLFHHLLVIGHNITFLFHKHQILRN